MQVVQSPVGEALFAVLCLLSPAGEHLPTMLMTPAMYVTTTHPATMPYNI